MMITPAVIAVAIVRTIVAATIRTVMIWPRKIEMIMIGIGYVNPERPTSATDINRTVEISCLHKTAILLIAQYPMEIVIAHIQIVVITIQGPFLTPKDIIHQIAYTGNEVIIYFVHVIILFCIQIQFIGHLVRKKAGLFTHFAVAHCGKKYKYNPFHNPSFF